MIKTYIKHKPVFGLPNKLVGHIQKARDCQNHRPKPEKEYVPMFFGDRPAQKTSNSSDEILEKIANQM